MLTFNNLKILIVGDIMLDRYWYGAVDRISPEAPVPVVRITREENRLGGCANVAYNVVSLGAHSSLLSVVGDDEASHLLEDLVAKTGIAPYWAATANSKPQSSCASLAASNNCCAWTLRTRHKTKCWPRKPTNSCNCFRPITWCCSPTTAKVA